MRIMIETYKRQDGEALGAKKWVREVVRMRGGSEISQSHQKPTTKMPLFLRGCLGLLCSRFSNSAPAPRCQTHLAPRTPLQEKRGAGGQLHVFLGVPQEVLHQLHIFYGVAPAPQTPRWSCSMVEFVERSWKNGSRAVPNTP
jgi:hypothetical protein